MYAFSSHYRTSPARIPPHASSPAPASPSLRLPELVTSTAPHISIATIKNAPGINIKSTLTTPARTDDTTVPTTDPRRHIQQISFRVMRCGKDVEGHKDMLSRILVRPPFGLSSWTGSVFDPAIITFDTLPADVGEISPSNMTRVTEHARSAPSS